MSSTRLRVVLVCGILLLVVVAAFLLKSMGFTLGMFGDSRAKMLVTAAETGDVDTVNELIQSGVDPNARGGGNTTPLLVAFQKRSKASFDALIRAGADPNLFDDRGRAVMFDAAVEEDSRWLEIALKHGGNANLMSPGTTRSSKGITPIFYAVQDYRAKNVKLLIAAGADLDHIEGGGMTVLRAAVGRSAYDMVFILIEAGADFRKKDAAREDLLDWVSTTKERNLDENQKVWFRKTVQLLKSKGAKFEVQD